jgi:hypothetical protein
VKIDRRHDDRIVAKANKKTEPKPKGGTTKVRSDRADPMRLQKLFEIASQGGNPKPSTPRFSKANQPKRRPGRPPGAENFLTKEIKKALVDAASMYGLDGTGLGGLTGYFYRGCDMQMSTIRSGTPVDPLVRRTSSPRRSRRRWSMRRACTGWMGLAWAA